MTGIGKGLSTADVERKYLETGRNVSATARHFGVTRTSIRKHLMKTGSAKKPFIGGSVKGTQHQRLSSPGQVKRYILTSAQNNTRVPEQMWSNLLALADHLSAELMVGTFSYNKNSYGPMSVKYGTSSPEGHSVWYDDRLLPYIVDRRVQLAPDLFWCGEMNILPTASRPLQGLATYTGNSSSIFPHSKISMESIATSPSDPAKLLFTTGCCTMKNYVQKLAGLRAEFHHAYGALLVEVDTDGVWFARQLNCDGRWRIFDLDIVVEGGRVSASPGIEAVVWGDIHAPRTDPEVSEAVFGEGGALDQLKPRVQFFHDIIDFWSRSHHEVKRHISMFERHVAGVSISDEMHSVNDFLRLSHREWCKSVVVNSNHDRHLERWINESDFRADPLNAELQMDATRAWYAAIRSGDSQFLLLEWVLRHCGLDVPVNFLRRDESRLVLDVEHGMHGDEGPNGVKGTAANISRIGRKVTMGDKHSAQIHDGVYVAGTFSKLDMSYNHGPSSWSHSFVVMYQNGKRAIITMRGKRWRVQDP